MSYPLAPCPERLYRWNSAISNYAARSSIETQNWNFPFATFLSSMKYPLLNFSLFSSSLSQISICDENQCEISPEHPLGPCPSTNYVCRDQCVGYSCDCKEWLESRHFISTFDIASASHFSSISWFVQSIFVIRRICFQPRVNPAVFLIHCNWRIAVAFLWRSKSNFCLFLIIF